MPQIAVVAASLWDLRVQCEQQMRAITDAQRLIDKYRDAPDRQCDAKRRLLTDLGLLVTAHATIGEALGACERAIQSLPTSGPELAQPPAGL